MLLVLTSPKPAVENARTSYDPYLDHLLLEHGYHANIINVQGMRGLRASQRSYPTSLWSRDLDYAISGYAFALGDMSIFRESIELFLFATDEDGVVPETIYLDRNMAENRWSWDSMPNLIHAVYVYVAKTGDRGFYHTHRDTLQRIGAWIVALDATGDGLPDQDVFPYGYYDSIHNGVMHTYALAKFYAAYCELAELERYAGYDGSEWEEHARRLRAGFHRPAASGGYWLDDQPWPIAWRRADGSIEPLLETFGVFEALRSGLIAPDDGKHYRALIDVLHERLPELIDGPTPMRLTLGGYPSEVRRVVDPPVPMWMLDASAPWVVGPAVLAYAAAGYADDAQQLLDAYAAMARTTDPPVLEFAAGPEARYGAGTSLDGGRSWDSAAWFMAVYGGHYGLTMTPEALFVRPRPMQSLNNDAVQRLSYQGARLQLRLDRDAGSYRIRADRATSVRLYPMYDATLIQVDGGAPQTMAALMLQPGHEYLISSIPARWLPIRYPTPFTAR